MYERELEITACVRESCTLIGALARESESRAPIEDQASDGLVGREAKEW
jgi:hypothetical protein